MPSSVNTEARHKIPRLTLRWKWYHFYFVLALFDLVVIIGTLVLYKQVTSSYQVALRELGAVDDQQRCLADLRAKVVELNAPGNDIFETRNVTHERARFNKTLADLRTLMSDECNYGLDLSGFRGFIARMVEEENTIFDGFFAGSREGLTAEDWQPRLDESVSAMAAMDRFLAGALSELDTLGSGLSHTEDRLRKEYGKLLERGVANEWLILAVVVVILVGIFLYGRKLQKLHDQMTRDRERALRERSDRLAAIGELCSAVAHGIRNPLAAINTSAQLALEYGSLNAESHRRVTDILSEGRRLGRRINRLLDFADSPVKTMEAFDLHDVVKQAIVEVTPRLKECDIQVESDWCDETINVHGNREWLVQSVIEILSNAMDQLEGQGHVHISCRTERDGGDNRIARLTIKDNGPGIPDAIRDRVFDLFFTSKDRGIGIGLASVRRAVEFHGGSVTLGAGTKGACIEMTLPLESSRTV